MNSPSFRKRVEQEGPLGWIPGWVPWISLPLGPAATSGEGWTENPRRVVSAQGLHQSAQRHGRARSIPSPGVWGLCWRPRGALGREWSGDNNLPCLAGSLGFVPYFLTHLSTAARAQLASGTPKHSRHAPKPVGHREHGGPCTERARLYLIFELLSSRRL